MDLNQGTLKKLSETGLAALAFLLIGSVFFYKERVLFADGSYLSFDVINYKTIKWERFGSFIPQAFPYMGQALHLHLKTLLILYSLSFNLFYFITAVILVYCYREYQLSVIMILFYFLFFSDSYFWVSEIPLAISWMFLFFSTIIFLGKKHLGLFLLSIPFALLGSITISTHPLIIVPAIFLWVYLIYENKNWPFSKTNSIVLTCLFVTVIAFGFARMHLGSDTHLHAVTHFSLQDIFDAFKTPVIYMFLYRCVVNYWIGTTMLIISITYLLRSRKYFLSAWILVSCMSYFISIGITYGNYDKNLALHHIETEWQGIGIIIATPFVFHLLPRLKRSVSTWLLIGIFIVRLTYIGASAPRFGWRVHFQERVLLQMRKKKITKLALYFEDSIRAKCIQDWALTYETILNSGIQNDKPQNTFFFVNRDDRKTIDLISHSNGYYDTYNMLSPHDLNNEYFAPDTSQPYQIMTYEELFK